MGKGFKGKSSTQDLIVERVLYLNSCHPRIPPCHPRGSGEPGSHATHCGRQGIFACEILSVTLGPRFRGDDGKGGGGDRKRRGDDGKGGGDDGKGSGDDGLQMKRPLLSNLMIFPGQLCASAGVTGKKVGGKNLESCVYQKNIGCSL